MLQALVELSAAARQHLEGVAWCLPRAARPERLFAGLYQQLLDRGEVTPHLPLHHLRAACISTLLGLQVGTVDDVGSLEAMLIAASRKACMHSPAMITQTRGACWCCCSSKSCLLSACTQCPSPSMQVQEADDWPQQAAARALQDALQGRGQWDVSPRSRASEWRSLAVLPVRLLAWLAQVGCEIAVCLRDHAI